MSAPRSTVPVPEILDGPSGDRLWLALARVLRGLEHLAEPEPATPTTDSRAPAAPAEPATSRTVSDAG